MTTDQTGVIVYRDEAGHLYVRVPDEQRDAVERMLAEQDTTGYIGGASAVVVQGGLTAIGGISQLSNPLALHGIIVIGGMHQ